MKTASKSRGRLVLLGIAAVAYISLTNPTVQINSSARNASAALPAPAPGQKKVVLKNLGMA